jgi:hypothetical protein
MKMVGKRDIMDYAPDKQCQVSQFQIQLAANDAARVQISPSSAPQPEYGTFDLFFFDQLKGELARRPLI